MTDACIFPHFAPFQFCCGKKRCPHSFQAWRVLQSVALFMTTTALCPFVRCFSVSAPCNSYVHHLPDSERGEAHGESLTRLCTYPHWPSHSLPRLVRRLVDRLIRSYLAVTLKCESCSRQKCSGRGSSKIHWRARRPLGSNVAY